MSELRGSYLPPSIPVVTASQEMVRAVLHSLKSNDSSFDPGFNAWPTPFSQVRPAFGES